MKVKTTQIKEYDLKKLCKEKGMSIPQLAKISGVNYQYLNRCINGIYTMSDETWDKIKKWL
jgi:transcriptional regulator with XRE-family HTH domain